MNSDNSEELKLELERLRAENEALKKTKSSQITFKVGKKGGMSLYGLGRFPVTLYKSQWIMLLEASEKITEFLINHDDELK
tara:strand:+ start:421 stop:663 length:243 start_codon:yes stop_codon:yes gene_type:complete